MGEVVIRPYVDGDEDAVLGLLADSLGWLGDAEHRAFFRWKHLDNPAGRSAMWVAAEGESLVGFRAMLRWRFLVDGEPVEAVRAVDTATAPEARGLGVFRRLTMHAVDALTDEGVGFVFNTPNDQSRPGYLKMGWVELGRPPGAVHPTGPVGLVRMARSRVPAELWSLPLAGDLDDPAAVLDLEPDGVDRGLRTDRSAAHLRWRYAGFPPLRYRLVRTEDAAAIYRLRRRGRATEAVICETFGRGDAVGHLAREVCRQARPDYTIRLGVARRRGFELPLPGGGPVVTWRSLRTPEPFPFEAWRLGLGDVELL